MHAFNRGVTASFFAIFLLPATGYTQALEEITVTARKTAENMQEVPMAITAISEQAIQRLGIKDLNKLADQDPSVQFDEGFSPSDTRLTIRGLSPTRGRPNAATLVDGIDVGSEAVSNPGGSVLVNARLLDVARIEIVKGPQSALYGRSAFAGAIQYVTKDPSDVLEATLALDYNSEQDAEMRASVSMPITDELGMIVNGYAWDNRGYHRNSVTDAYLGGGEGTGASVTFKWEPTDNIDFKWRTEYTDDETKPPAQVGLNAFNKWVDLGTNGQFGNFTGDNIGPSNLAPNSSNCFIGTGSDGQPNPSAGPLANPGCLASKTLTDHFAANLASDLGIYDPNDVGDFNQYNRQVVNTFLGKIPDGDTLRATVNPNYTFGPGAKNPLNAVDYEGVDKEVFRTSLVANWTPSDDLRLTSYTGYTDANVTTQQDIGRYYIDECSVDQAALFSVPDPTETYSSYGDAINAQGITDLARFAPCSIPQGDGVNDAKGGFTQDDENETQQFSQEFRAAWQINDTVNFTTGILYWRENVKVSDKNITLITGGPECYAVLGADASQSSGGQLFTQTDPIQDQCGNTQVVGAYWLSDAWEANAADPNVQERTTRHYSWYGSVEWDLGDKFKIRAEGRYTREENDVTAPNMTPCLNGAPANNPSDPDSCITGGRPLREVFAAGGQPTGPSTVPLCGSNGRCDRLGIAPISNSPWYPGAVSKAGTEFSWWEYGYASMLSYQSSPDTRKDRYWTPKLTVEYYPTDDVMTYASWSRGIKPGGYSLLTVGAFGLDPNLDGVFDEAEFEPERLDVWEIGMKSTLLDGRLRLNGAMFYQDFKDKQISLQKVIGNTTGIVTDNISGSEIKGLEIDATLQATDNLIVSFGYTYLDSEYTDYTQITNSATTTAKATLGSGAPGCQDVDVIPGSEADPKYGCVVSFNGNELERSPKHSVNASATYTRNLLATGMDWYSTVNFRYQDSRFIEHHNIAQLQSYSLTDFQLGLIADSWELQLYVDNVFDEDIVRSAGPTVGIPNANFAFGLGTPPALGSAEGILAGPVLPQDLYANMPNPRILGVRVNWRFGG